VLLAALDPHGTHSVLCAPTLIVAAPFPCFILRILATFAAVITWQRRGGVGVGGVAAPAPRWPEVRHHLTWSNIRISRAPAGAFRSIKLVYMEWECVDHVGRLTMLLNGCLGRSKQASERTGAQLPLAPETQADLAVLDSRTVQQLTCRHGPSSAARPTVWFLVIGDRGVGRDCTRRGMRESFGDSFACSTKALVVRQRQRFYSAQGGESPPPLGAGLMSPTLASSRHVLAAGCRASATRRPSRLLTGGARRLCVRICKPPALTSTSTSLPVGLLARQLKRRTR